MITENKIKLEELQNKLKEVINLGYGKTIELKFNGFLIPEFNLLRFLIPTKDNLIYLKKYSIDLKINGEDYKVLDDVGEKINEIIDWINNN